MKIVMLLLLISTVAAVVIAAIGFEPASQPTGDAIRWWSAANFAFVLAFMGWMPIPIDSAIWNSIWVREHGRACGKDMTKREACFDFRVGYIGAGVVAVLFLSLGAMVMHHRVGELKDGAGFVNQLIDVYGQTLGGWSVPLISAAALTTMFSTTLVVLDAFPRAMHRLTQAIRSIDPDESRGRRSYIGWVLAQAGLAMAILLFFKGGMKAMVDLATTLSFLTAPMLALINYLVITRHAPVDSRPGKSMRLFSIGSILFLLAFSLAYLGWLIR
jgi:Mn2+/Fe2+ NRAMP family transporter